MLKQQQPACLVFDLNIPESHGRSRMRLQVRLTARRLLPVPVVVVAFANLMSHNCAARSAHKRAKPWMTYRGPD
jgi:FixJ family two-component response regulator